MLVDEDEESRRSDFVESSKKRSPNPIDIHVGKMIRVRRTVLGLSQSQLAKLLGITFQQVQKYEKGTNRVSASRLVDLSRVLDVSIDHFFKDIDDQDFDTNLVNFSSLAEDQDSYEIKNNLFMSREFLELARSYYKIKDEKQRKSVIALCRSLSQSSED